MLRMLASLLPPSHPRREVTACKTWSYSQTISDWQSCTVLFWHSQFLRSSNSYTLTKGAERMIISNENQEKALIFFLQRPESISMRARLLLCAKRLRPLFSTWLTARHCGSVRGYWGEGGRWERRQEEDERKTIGGRGRRRSWKN